MKTLAHPTGLALLAFTLTSAVAGETSAQAVQHWPKWRGPLGTGVSPTADPPLQWSETENLKWKVALPGFGTATPIIWGDRVFIHTAIAAGAKAEPQPSTTGSPATPAEPGQRRGGFNSEAPRETYQFVVLCLDRPTGKTLWQKTVRETTPHEGHHRDHGFASASPVTDGEHLLAYFGSRGLHCLDLDGNVKLSKEFGQMKTRNSFGEGSSPALHGDTVVIYQDDETESDFIAAFDKHTGKELWRTPRDEATGWSTPLIVEHAGKPQVIVNATGKVRSYDLTSGKELWSCTGQTANCIPSPVTDGDTVYVTSGFRGSALYAIMLGRAGDLTDPDAIRWSYKRNTPYVPSPLLVDGSLYLFKENTASLSCFDAQTGKPRFEGERLEGIFGVYASPVSAKDRIYALGREGKCLVLKQGAKVGILATNKLDDKTDASIALAGKDLFIRGHKNRYCLAEK